MTQLTRLACAAVLLAGIGCVGLSESDKTAQVSGAFFEAAPTTVAKSPVPVAEESLCVRVDYVGRKVLAANPQIGLRPYFATIQSPAPEIFHAGVKTVDVGDRRLTGPVVYITDGMVKQLPSEADLAAVLSYELARMVAEREARVKQDLRSNPPRPPIELPIGAPGPRSATDMVSTVEMARYDKQRIASQKPAEKINTDTLARNFLEGAGFQRTELDRVQPLLQAAEKNSALERQIKGLPAPNAWTK